MSERLRVGVAGIGMIARQMHLPNLAALSSVEVVALWSRSPDSLRGGAAALANARPALYQDYRTFLGHPALDAVLITAPDHLHEEMFVAAIDAGKHVYLEKPPAITREGNQRVGRLAAATDRVTMIGLQNRYSPLYTRGAELVAAGAIGRPRMLWVKEYRIPFLPKREGWIMTRAGTGGSLLVKCIHFFDLFLWYAGAPATRVMTSGASGVVPKQETLDHAWVLVDHANGVRACLGMVLFAPQGERVEIELIGEQGRIALSVEDQMLTLETGAGVDVEQVMSTGEHFHPGSRLAIDDFVRCCLGGGKPRAEVGVGVEAALLALAAEQSAAEGRPIDLTARAPA